MRDFLTCLASPDGHRVAFSYKKSWFDPDLLTAGLLGRAATIVFCEPTGDPSDRRFSFLAVRHAEICRLVPTRADDLLPGSAITVEFLLRALVAARDSDLPDLRRQWNQTLGSHPKRPRPRDAKDAGESCFVFASEQLPESEGALVQQDCWRTLSVALGDCGTLNGAFFFRVSPMLKPGSRKSLKVESVGALAQVYQLRTSEEYEVPLEAYSASGKVPYSQAIAATASSDVLAVQALTQSSAGRASEAVLVVRASEVYRPQIGTVIVAGRDDFSHQVPRVEIAAQVTRNNWVAGLLVVFIALGVFAGGLSKGALGTGNWSYLINVAGSLLAAGLTVLAIGRGIKK